MRIINQSLLAIGLAALLVIAGPIRITRAATGDLDQSFGSGGKVVSRFSYDSKLSAVATQSDGKIVAAGYNRQTVGAATDLAVVRYDIDGGLDQSFGNGGLVTTGHKGSWASDVVVQGDGKILAAGTVDSHFALVRYNSDGSIDESFGGSGFVTTDFFDSPSDVTSVVLQPNGKIIAAGYSYPRAGLPISDNLAMARFNSDGSLDGSFGEQGKISEVSTPNSILVADVALQQDGQDVKIVVLETDYGGGSDYDWILARYNSDGSVDHSFGVDGKTRVDFGGYDQAKSLDIDAEGRIVAYGTTGDGVFYYGFSDLALARFDVDGSLDTKFGKGGKVKSDFGRYETASSVVHQPDGKLLVAGNSGDNPAWAGNLSDFLLARFNADGRLDSSFGSGGKMTTDFGRSDRATAIALQPDGKLIAVGYTADPTFDGLDQSDFALARYTAFILPDFTLESASKTITVPRGEKLKLTIDVNRIGDFVGRVAVMAPDVSALKMKVTPDNASTTSASIEFNIKVKQSAPPGEHQLVFVAHDDSGRERDLALTVVIR